MAEPIKKVEPAEKIPNQLSSYQQARDLRDRINAFKVNAEQGVMGGGIKPGDDEFDSDPNVGIQRPSWIDAGNQPEIVFVGKDGTQYFGLVFNFKNGTGGFNVGMSLERLANSGMTEEQYFRQLAQQVKDAEPKD